MSTPRGAEAGRVLRRWWAAGPDWGTPLAEVDLRPGGRYRLSMREPGGAVHTVGGEYLEVRRPERLVYTWAWEDEPGDESGGADNLGSRALAPA